MTSLEAINQSLFLSLNADALSPTWELILAKIAAEDFIYAIPLCLACFWLWGTSEQRNLALKACIIAVVALGVNQLLAVLWPHPRPFIIGLGHTYIPHVPDSSFPSDHATVFAAVGLTLVFANWRSLVGWGTLWAGVGVAWARVFLGVHFPLDMVGAFAVAVLAWLVVSPIWRLLGTRITAFATQLYGRVLAHPIALGWIRP
ncbi:phosphatase PAP2 family protein [Noviherbaspirillum pedocola]|uniref:Phosphatase PAP2 family protein n=1 Tax=Noviherbaspirillum pedocola TaxID=2801341 RepID=A0A934W6Z5_9BURK|nr:phosphatase PAP2 family protein [Noviherbaspirillum pedocola]MBK4736782.1 phosphatase PAP2 family protein [Noviherbaspirillum pedocola]